MHEETRGIGSHRDGEGEELVEIISNATWTSAFSRSQERGSRFSLSSKNEPHALGAAGRVEAKLFWSDRTETAFNTLSLRGGFY